MLSDDTKLLNSGLDTDKCTNLRPVVYTVLNGDIGHIHSQTKCSQTAASILYQLHTCMKDSKLRTRKMTLKIRY